MNKMSNSIVKTVPAAGELRQVRGFNPLAYLRPAMSKATGEKGLKLDLSYKKMWFRLACPQGKMHLNPLRITDQMAIFEARLYAGPDDASLITNFVSTKQASEAPGGRYLKEAQDEALNEALDNAGFGIQLCDLIQTDDKNCYGSEISLTRLLELAQQTGQPVPTEHAAVTPTPAAEPSAKLPPPTQQTAAKQVQAEQPVEPSPPKDKQAPVVTAAPEPTVSAPSATTAPASVTPPSSEPKTEQTETSDETTAVLEMLGGAVVTEKEEPKPQPSTPTVEQAEVIPLTTTPAESESTAAVLSYSVDMSVDEIRSRMTAEQARAIQVEFGTCKEMTLGEVLDRRPSSLRYYMYVCKDANNVLKAAASLLVGEMPGQKAG